MLNLGALARERGQRGAHRPALRHLETPPSSLGLSATRVRYRSMGRSARTPSLKMQGDRNVDRQRQEPRQLHTSRRGAVAVILAGLALLGREEEVKAQPAPLYKAGSRVRGEWYFKDGTWFKRKSQDEADDDGGAESLTRRSPEALAAQREQEEEESRREQEEAKRREAAAGAEREADERRLRLRRAEEERQEAKAAAERAAADKRHAEEEERRAEAAAAAAQEQEQEDKRKGLLPLLALGGLGGAGFVASLGSNASLAPSSSQDWLELLSRGRCASASLSLSLSPPSLPRPPSLGLCVSRSFSGLCVSCSFSGSLAPSLLFFP